ncbi:cytochrome c oxidase subunit 3 [Mycolicibacterium sp. S2-37]|uniref:cytochrome c oxidase subunit 3 n=1 Tax=Mycolicibacterium sp. S2-37 TaxID=2810297 RepID=UPI001F5F933F|nr:cytochrome c oxidase subunit 3 [Mycolicibacterium sp. S2-37]
MWVMVIGDLLIFGAYFIIFMVHRALNPDDFLAGQQQLDLTVGAVNTVVLLTSSWFVARGVVAARVGNHTAAVRFTGCGAMCGALFIATKVYEWSATAGDGHSLSETEFFGFYYMLTGVHLFHVALGLLILGIVGRELRTPHRCRMPMVESGAVYWHMVDLLWIVIFTLLYVMR